MSATSKPWKWSKIVCPNTLNTIVSVHQVDPPPDGSGAVAWMSSGDKEANAADIVCCANAHEGLLDACEAALAALSELIDSRPKAAEHVSAWGVANQLMGAIENTKAQGAVGVPSGERTRPAATHRASRNRPEKLGAAPLSTPDDKARGES